MAYSSIRCHLRVAVIIMTLNMVKIGSLELSDSCLDHSECPRSRFCAASRCTDDLGRKFPCGECKPCGECRCNVDAFDHACPQQQCPDQPTDGVRFLQGPFHAISPLAGTPTHLCVRRLLFTSGTFSDIQFAVRTDHPASAGPTNISALSVLCPSFVRVGAVVNITVLDGAFAVDVYISSEGRPRAPSLSSSQ
jgi:hypothetical protein